MIAVTLTAAAGKYAIEKAGTLLVAMLRASALMVDSAHSVGMVNATTKKKIPRATMPLMGCVPFDLKAFPASLVMPSNW